MRRNWIKLYVDQTLRGSCFEELLPEERFVWFGFLLLAGDNSIEGKISVTNKMGYSIEQLADLLNCSVELIKRSIKKMIKNDKIKVNNKNVITIINWKKYQSEYQRQRDYREENKKRKLQRKVITQGNKIDRDRDIERDKDKDKDNNTARSPKELQAKGNISFNFEINKWENIKEEDTTRWKETYPACDINLGLKQMREWLIANPKKKKKNYRRFIINWFIRWQEKGGSIKSAKYEQQFRT